MGSIEGDLSMMPLPDLTVWMANRKVSGSLTIERGPEQQSFDLVDGAAVRAASNSPQQYFGQFLLHYELVTEEQLQQAYQTQRETGVRLGRILVMIGLVPEEQVIQCLRVKIAETMLHAFRWSEGRFRLTDTVVESPTQEIALAVPLIDIHTEGHNRDEVWQTFDDLFARPTMLVSVNDMRIPRDLEVGSFRERLLILAKRGLSIEALTLETHASDYALAQELVELYRAGVIAPQPPTTGLVPPLATPEQGQDHLDLAQLAMNEGRYSEALEHAKAGASQRPEDSRALALVAQISDRAVQQTENYPPRGHYPVLVVDPDPGDLKRLTAKERYILARVDGKQSVQAIMQVSPMHDVEALDVMRAFHRDGWIRFDPPNIAL